MLILLSPAKTLDLTTPFADVPSEPRFAADAARLARAAAKLTPAELSGLDGVLRPLDAMRPYRLEMGTRWAPKGGRLVDHWGRKVAKSLLTDLAVEGSNIILNLASREYFAVAGPFVPKKVRLIAPDFRVRTARGLQFQSFTAKVARGALARFVCDERIADPAGIEAFERDGWRFDADGSTAEVPLFIRT
jgi:cytoplasmic iron level regulating protein YaaA (DUF328/UPF0246 family)